MQSQPYLIFSLSTSLYGVEATSVQEIFFLPELTPVVEAPRDIVGVVNLRGDILPVMDLNLRLGYQPSEYCLTDSAIVLAVSGLRVGIIVNQVHEVQILEPSEMAQQLLLGREGINDSRFVTAIAKLGADIVMLLNLENLIRSVETPHLKSLQTSINNENIDSAVVNDGNSEAAEVVLKEHRIFCQSATPEEKAIFRERAANLMLLNEARDFNGLLPIAVIGLNGEYFGLDLQVVREFSDIGNITPIPCCPAHIVGNMNLRGEIVTLVDIRPTLSLTGKNTTKESKAMVVHIDELIAGVMVDEVLDVMYLNLTEIKAAPAAVNTQNDKFLRGTASYREKMMGILDMPKILLQGGLTVDEEV